MDLVLSNSVFSVARTNAAGRRTITLYTGRDQVRTAMEEFCVNDKQKRLAAKPSQDVEAYEGRIELPKVKVRPSYLNAVLIQSRGTTGMTCTHCARDPTRGPFTECRRTKGHFEGCCGNCKWRDHGAKCSVRMEGEESDDGRMIEGNQKENPIVIDSEEE